MTGIQAASYIGDLVGELARLARSSRQELLVYFLTLAKMEAEAIVRGGSESSPE